MLFLCINKFALKPVSYMSLVEYLLHHKMHSCYHISFNMYSNLPRFCRILLSSTLEWDLHAVTNVILEVYWKFNPKSKGFWLAPHSSLCRSIVYVKQVILRNTFCGHTSEVLVVFFEISNYPFCDCTVYDYTWIFIPHLYTFPFWDIYWTRDQLSLRQ